VSSLHPEATDQEQDVVELPANRAIVLRNTTCAYCGRPFEGELRPTKEHVIGRRFVPRGCFDGQWNLILCVCERCNNDKAGLEDDISAITMMPDLTGQHAIDDDRLRAEVARKAAKSRSRRTGKAVADSHEEIAIKGRFGPATFTFHFVAPAQVEEERLFRMALYQFRGFFYWITYNTEARRGGFAPGGFFPVLAVRRADWGAARARWFMEIARTWHLRVHAIAADGFCKILIRKSPDADLWCWAVEWNHAYRIVGFAGDESAAQHVMAALPEQRSDVVHQTETEWVRMRTETPLPDVEDDLFAIIVSTRDDG